MAAFSHNPVASRLRTETHTPDLRRWAGTAV
jgi:hypothetical protein